MTGQARAAQAHEQNAQRKEENIPLAKQGKRKIILKSLEARMRYLNQFIRTKYTTKNIDYAKMTAHPDDSVQRYRIFTDDSVVPGPGERCRYDNILVPNGFTYEEENYVKQRLSTLAFRNVGEMLKFNQLTHPQFYRASRKIEFRGFSDYELLENVSGENLKTAVNAMLDTLSVHPWSLDELKEKKVVLIKVGGTTVADIRLNPRKVPNLYDLTVLTGK